MPQEFVPMRKIFQPLLWALVGAAIAGGVFFLLNQPRGASITIVVPSPTVVSSPTPTTAGKVALTPEPQRININTASVALLDTLPGIGEVKAQAIVDYRNQNGPFLRVDELMKVPGIGPVTYQEIRDLVTVGESP